MAPPAPPSPWRALPCQPVFEWKSSPLSLLFPSSTPPPSILHRTQKGHLLSSEPLVESCLSSEKNNLLACQSLKPDFH